MNMRSGIAVICILCTFLTCSPRDDKDHVPDAGAADRPACGDFLIQSSLGDASNLIPMLASDSASHEVAGLIYNGLVTYDKDFTIVGDLAKSWEISDGGKRLRFHLRPGVRWHDGAPLTARDVLFTYHTIIDPSTPTAYAGKYKLVKEARLLDELTIEFTYETPFAPALISWALQILPEHLLKGQELATSPLTRRPVGSGPFRFQRWETGTRIVLTANEDYFNGRPYLDGVVYRVIPDLTTQFMELKAAAIDIMGLTPLQYLRQTDTPGFSSRFAKYKYLADAYTYLGFNQRRAPFDQRQVRQAIAHAIDKEEIIKGVLLGLGEIATGPYKPGTRWYNPEVKRYPYDPHRALSMLNALGWSDHDGDGILDRQGKPFTFTIITNQGNPAREKAAQIIQQRLGAIGIKANLRIIEWTVFLKEYVDKGNFDAVILGWNILQDPDLFTVWHSSNARPGGLNFTGFSNPEADEMIMRGRHTFDGAARKRAYDHLQEILAEEQPYVFLFVPYSLPAVSARFHGIEPAPAGITYNLERWYVPEGLQRYHVEP